MDGTSVRIENSSRAHTDSLRRYLTAYTTDVVRNDGRWQLDVQLGELGTLLVDLFASLGTWLDENNVDSLLLHFDERQFTFLRPAEDRLEGSSAFLLERVAQLETALQSRIVIEQAKGILAHALELTPDDAFEQLRTAARNRSTPLRELAAAIVADPGRAAARLRS